MKWTVPGEEKPAAGGDIPGLHRARKERGGGTLRVHAVRLKSLRQRNQQMIASRVGSLVLISNGDELKVEELLALPGSTSQYPIEVRLDGSSCITAYRIQTSDVDADADPAEWILEGLEADTQQWREMHHAGPPLYKLPHHRREWSETYNVPDADYGALSGSPQQSARDPYQFISPEAFFPPPSPNSPSPTYLVGVDTQDSHRELFRLICEKSIRDSVQVTYRQEDVTCGSVKGTLFLVSPRESTVWAYVIWVPYCLLMTVNPDLLSQKAKSALVDLDGLPIFAGEEEDEILYEGPFRSEWKQACVVPDSKLHSFKKDSKVFGDKSITITSSPEPGNPCHRHTHGPFTFKAKGLSKFIIELGKHIPITPLAHDERTFVVDHALMCRSGMSAAVDIPTTNDSFDDPLAFPTASPSTVVPPKEKKRRNFLDSFKSNRSSTYGGGASNQSDATGSNSPGSPERKREEIGVVLGVREEHEDEAFDAPENIFDEADDFADAASRGPPLTLAEWQMFLDDEGKLEPSRWSHAKRKMFRGGVDSVVRPDVWRYLLGIYPVGSSTSERAAIYTELETEYNLYLNQWKSITKAQKCQFALFRDRLQRVEKDVVRTDRAIELFEKDDGPGMRALHNILVSYSFFNFDLGYCQGMSDIVATLYHVFGNEVETFHGFCYLMRERIEVCFQRDQSGIAENLRFIGSLLELTDPNLVRYFEKIDATNFYFCFRWIVVTFKREFPFQDVMKLWDVLWTCPFDDEYQLLVAATILKLASPVIQSRQMTFDEVLKFINDLSQKIPLNYILRKTQELYEELAAQHPVPEPSLKDMVVHWEEENLTSDSGRKKGYWRKGLGVAKNASNGKNNGFG